MDGWSVGESGTVDAIEFAATPQVMYNMTVADAHTYTVGDGEWVVHNSCWTSNVRRGLSPVENAFEHWKKHRADFPNMNNALEYLNETRKFLSDPPSAALILTRSNGDLVVYDPVSQIFAIAMGDGTPRTMYIPDPVVHGYLTNLDYFFAQAK